MSAADSSSILTYELPPIRPPSEARSLLIRAMRGCPWNYCTFCSVYKDLPRKNMLRSVGEVKGDIDALRASADELRMQGYSVEPKSAFLADSNAVIMKTDGLVEIISYLLATFPSLQRVTSYARAKTILAKEPEELRRLRKAGLDRLHVGLESGDDGVLARVKKGATAREMIDAGGKAKEAGFELSLYVMPGLGGRARSPDHVRGTVDVLNATNPDFIRVRPLQVTPGTPLFDELVAGEFDPMSLVEMLEELRHIVAGLETSGNICFDHFMNAPIFDQSWEGYKLPESAGHLLTIMDEALSSAAGRR